MIEQHRRGRRRAAEEETTYDGRKLRGRESAKKALWTMKDAYKRRRTKARVEKTARLKQAATSSPSSSPEQVIEEETGSAGRCCRSTGDRRSTARPAVEARRAEEADRPRRQERPALLRARLDRATPSSASCASPRASCATGPRTASRRSPPSAASPRSISPLVEEGIEDGRKLMEEMIKGYQPNPAPRARGGGCGRAAHATRPAGRPRASAAICR